MEESISPPRVDSVQSKNNGKIWLAQSERTSMWSEFLDVCCYGEHRRLKCPASKCPPVPSAIGEQGACFALLTPTDRPASPGSVCHRQDWKGNFCLLGH